MIEITYKVKGMRCGMCEAHVNDAIRKLGNIKKVSSSFKKGETVVVADESIDIEEIKRCITSLGYDVNDIMYKPYVKKGLFGFKK